MQYSMCSSSTLKSKVLFCLNYCLVIFEGFSRLVTADGDEIGLVVCLWLFVSVFTYACVRGSCLISLVSYLYSCDILVKVMIALKLCIGRY